MKLKLSLTLIFFLANVPSYSQESNEVQNQVLPQQVVVNGSQTDIEASRDFVAGKLIIGREQITESGLQNVGEILKREPAISINKDGRVGLLGLPNYTQILIDGQPPMGKSAFELDLSQVEKIEIIKSSTAETGPFGISGTINIISRKIMRKNFQQLGMGITQVAGEYGVKGSWNLNQFSLESPLSFNLNISAKNNHTPNESSYIQIQRSGSNSFQPQFEGQRNGLRIDKFLTLSSELSYKLNSNNSFSFKPDIGHITLIRNTSEQRTWNNGHKLLSQQNSSSPMTGYGLPLSWSHDTGENGRIDLKMHFNRMSFKSNDARYDQDATNTKFIRQQKYDNEQTNHHFSIDYKFNVDSDHDIKLGGQATRTYEDMVRTYWLNGIYDNSLKLIDGLSTTKQTKYRIFAQDDWRINKTLAFNAGLSAERLVLKIKEDRNNSVASYQIWSPSLHISKKLESDSKQQFRASLARSYKAPDSNQWMLQPIINSLAPCLSNIGCSSNTIDIPDSMGNPTLRPEQAIALNLAYEHGISNDSQVTFEIYTRYIKQKIGSEIVLTNVTWSDLSRYVERPANLGSAQLKGINLEWRVATKDIWEAAPKLDVRGSMGFAHSILSDLPAPDNRIEGQSPWSAKLGLTYAMENIPIKLDLDANWLPGNWYRNQATQRIYESHTSSLSMNASWKLNKNLRLIMNVDNLFAPQAERINEYQLNDNTLQLFTKNAAYTRYGLRIEMKL